MSLFFGIILFLYIVDVFVLIWLSGKFAGIFGQKFSEISFMGITIIMLTWLIVMALISVPFELKPFILGIGIALVIYIFVLLLDEHIAKSVAAGLFFILCQLIFVIVLFREVWSREFFRALRVLFFQGY